MPQTIKIYNERYENLPVRFVNKLENDLQYLINAEIPGLRKVYLFGSCARGEVRSSSDIDLLVYTEHKMEDRMLAADIRWTLDEAIDGVRTDIVYASGDTEQEGTVFRNILKRDKKLILEVLG
ncbi:nucleotidyltransferase domain-containing protein [Lachnospiraceae bacterium 46-15]